MAKAKKRWAVRESMLDGEWYWLIVGDEPRKPKDGWRNLVKRFDATPLPKDGFKQFFPNRYHLPFGGGPVEIRFTDEA